MTRRKQERLEMRRALAEYKELLEIASTWTPEPRQAQAMVEAYQQGGLERQRVAARHPVYSGSRVG